MLKKVAQATVVMLALSLSSQVVAENVQRSLCVFDVIGKNGDTYQLMKKYALQAKTWGVDFKLKHYTEESLVVSDFRSGKCDAIELFGIKNRDLVRFPGSLDMMAALPSYDGLYTAVAALSSPRAADKMKQGKYETVGIIPGGKVYLFSHNRDRLSDWNDLAGSKITVLSDDEQAVEMINYVGGSVLSASVSTFAGMFNSGSADLCYAPGFAYEALELYKGLGSNGGILKYNLGILTFQIDTHFDRFPEDFGQKSREWVYNNLWEPGMSLVRKAEADIPKDSWVNLDAAQKEKYNGMFADVRQRLYDNYDTSPVYDPEMQQLLKKIRCRILPGNAECTRDTEGGPVL